MAVTLASNSVINNMPNQDVTGSATATGSTATATLPAVAGKTNVCYGFDVTSTGTVTAGTVTVTGVGSGTLTYGYSPSGVAATGVPLVVQFTEPMICSTGINAAISVACTTLGAATSFVNVYGFLI